MANYGILFIIEVLGEDFTQQGVAFLLRIAATLALLEIFTEGSICLPPLFLTYDIAYLKKFIWIFFVIILGAIQLGFCYGRRQRLNRRQQTRIPNVAYVIVVTGDEMRLSIFDDHRTTTAVFPLRSDGTLGEYSSSFFPNASLSWLQRTSSQSRLQPAHRRSTLNLPAGNRSSFGLLNDSAILTHFEGNVPRASIPLSRLIAVERRIRYMIRRMWEDVLEENRSMSRNCSHSVKKHVKRMFQTLRNSFLFRNRDKSRHPGYRNWFLELAIVECNALHMIDRLLTSRINEINRSRYNWSASWIRRMQFAAIERYLLRTFERLLYSYRERSNPFRNPTFRRRG